MGFAYKFDNANGVENSLPLISFGTTGVIRYKLLSIFVCLCLFSALNAQYVFHKQWDYRYGGEETEVTGNTILQARDGGYIAGGSSKSSISGDRSEANWDSTLAKYDYWVVKLNSTGQKVWDKRFGGALQDNFYSLALTKDGGYILGGDSYSNADGDKTQTCRGGFDYWIVKIDSDGTKQWDKRFGGNGNESLGEVQQTTDGGYIIGGTSTSGLNGDKTQYNWGGGNKEDYWVVKTDSAGNKQWDKRFGGDRYDFETTIKQTKDGGFLLGGYSDSDTSGDKTQANWAYTYNFWVVRIDSMGNQLWDKRFGGTRGEHLLAMIEVDGGFVLAGDSYSDISGDKGQVSNGSMDYWIIKIDSAGNKIWDKGFGGNDEDQLYSIAKTTDGGYLLSGDSRTRYASGNKSEDNVVDLHNQPWIIKTDSLGNKEWDKTIMVGGAGFSSAVESSRGCYLVYSTTSAEIGWDKTQMSWNSSSDYWLLKFCMEPYTGINAQASESAQLEVYPNPFTSDISISLQKQNLHAASFTITNAVGQTIYHRQETNLSSNYTKMLDLSYLPNGLYFIAVEVDGERMIRQVVKQ
jgi:hypothetical protein